MQSIKRHFQFVYDWWGQKNGVILFILLGCLFVTSWLYEHFNISSPKWLVYLLVFLGSLPLFMCVIIIIDKNRNKGKSPFVCFGYYIVLGIFLFVAALMYSGRFLEGEFPDYPEIAFVGYGTIYSFALPCFYLCFLDKQKAQLLISIYRNTIAIISILVGLFISWKALFYIAPDIEFKGLVQSRLLAFTGISIIGCINVLLTATKMFLDFYHYKVDRTWHS